ncbi:helicase-related protein [Aliiglaciecola litoralis]|uniref:Helicase-related protein n=1 Tax=Aliiglaciecola litoralis TaxID=582857 RepID=A0ABN1LHV9_9ALTE
MSMIKSRAALIEAIRGELIGPFRSIDTPSKVELINNEFEREISENGTVFWTDQNGVNQEIVYYKGESPLQNYAIGLLHPNIFQDPNQNLASDITLKTKDEIEYLEEISEKESNKLGKRIREDNSPNSLEGEDSQDFELSNTDAKSSSNMAISVFAQFETTGKLVVNLPNSVLFDWQKSDEAFLVNGRYFKCKHVYKDGKGIEKKRDAWARNSAFKNDCSVSIDVSQLKHQEKIVICREEILPKDSPLNICLEVYPRIYQGKWLITIVLRNMANNHRDRISSTLFQSYFEVALIDGDFLPYPVSQTTAGFEGDDELSLKLLYSNDSTWAIGHGSAAGWQLGDNGLPKSIFLDVLPTSELPSMTPDISDQYGNQISLKMRDCANLPADESDSKWNPINKIVSEFEKWIINREAEIIQVSPELQSVAYKHMERCRYSLERMKTGLTLLKNDANAREAFRLANLSMMLQQIGSKQIKPRALKFNPPNSVYPANTLETPWDIYRNGTESDRLGKWRAFQIAFLLMSLNGVSDCDDENSLNDRELVDLVWFPTGGGKTEAYLAVAAYYMFHQRLLIRNDDVLTRDGTNVFMRYTLRMLTTQQFQRAASLICAMEYIRNESQSNQIITKNPIKGKRFTLGLWLGRSACPNSNKEALDRFRKFKKSEDSVSEGNPLVINECPWCKSQIGKADSSEKPRSMKDTHWIDIRIKGFREIGAGRDKKISLACSDTKCHFGGRFEESWLPIEVIDENLYVNPPTMFIATADKFAMLAYRPHAGALFGKKINGNEVINCSVPPGIIIQDELHLISGPLGTMYGAYEAVLEDLCTYKMENGKKKKPKIIASTATISGAKNQIKSLYDRDQLQLFPSPGIDMGDSFFGKYAMQGNNKRAHGRLYLGLLAEFGSVQTTQVRCFSSLIFHAACLEKEFQDPWWTLLCFYNSIRELSGGRTLFDSDIPARLKYLNSKLNIPPAKRRYIQKIYELTSRLSQSKLVELMDELNKGFADGEKAPADVCLASNIIEVGVDIDRLSVMSVIGQPKNTAQYIQVTGRVGRRWDTQPGLITTIYNPSKSRDRSHYEQFASYHSRLYEQVEATSATPFSESAIYRALPGVLLTWVRQQTSESIESRGKYESLIKECKKIVLARCQSVLDSEPDELKRAEKAIDNTVKDLIEKLQKGPSEWESYPPDVDEDYLMLWPGQFYKDVQKRKGVLVSSSMRQVDSSALFEICDEYGDEECQEKI